MRLSYKYFVVFLLPLFCSEIYLFSQEPKQAPVEKGSDLVVNNESLKPIQLSASFSELPASIKLEIGKLKAREIVEFDARIRNNTSNSCLPGSVVSSCSCAAATVSNVEIDPGKDVELKIRIAVPNAAGKFRRKLALVLGNGERLEVTLEGHVEMPFSIKDPEYVISKEDRTVKVNLESNEGPIDHGSVVVSCVTPDLTLKSVDGEGKLCTILLEATERINETFQSTVTIKATSLEGKQLEQALTLRVRAKASLELKPRVLRFRQSDDNYECRIFIYGEKSDITKLDLKNNDEVDIVYSETVEDLLASMDNPQVVKLRLRDLAESDYGLAGVLVANKNLFEGGKCFLKIAFRSGEFLDRQYLTIVE